jgi:hypothetical protein
MSDHSSHENHESSRFDREINLRAILFSGVGLVGVTIIAAALMWWLLKGFEGHDERHDPRPTPIEAANPQQPPPEPRLQVAPGFVVSNSGATAQSDREDMAAQAATESRLLQQPAWIDQGKGTLRVPIDVAMEVVAARGAAPEVVGGVSHAGVNPPAVPIPTPTQAPAQKH